MVPESLLKIPQQLGKRSSPPFTKSQALFPCSEEPRIKATENKKPKKEASVLCIWPALTFMILCNCNDTRDPVSVSGCPSYPTLSYIISYCQCVTWSCNTAQCQSGLSDWPQPPFKGHSPYSETVVQIIKKLQFTVPEGSLPCSQKPATGPCPKPCEWSSHTHILFLDVHFNIIHSFIPWAA
jgi:hypothetical protein